MAVNLGPIMSKMLARYGLTQLGVWLSKRITAGASPEEIELELYDRPEFIRRFPAIRERERAGLPPLSVDEYLSYEASASAAAKSLGVRISQDEINRLLTANVSINELVEDRLSLAARAVHMVPQEFRSELNRLYGIQDGDLIRYWLDPKKEAPELQRRFAAASISEQAQRTGFSDELSAQQAEGLVDRGMSADRAAEAFDMLVRAEELFSATDATEDDITIDDQLALLTGDTKLAEDVERRGERRAARFGEGGDFATGRTGVAGLGKATT